MGACFDLSIHYDLAVKNCFYRYKHSILTDGTIPCQVDTLNLISPLYSIDEPSYRIQHYLDAVFRFA